jgi:hypothetical protein
VQLIIAIAVLALGLLVILRLPRADQ